MITMATMTRAISPSTMCAASQWRQAGPISSGGCVRRGPGRQLCSGSGDSVGRRAGSGAATPSVTGYLRGGISAARFSTDCTASSW
jgi:hypothetical protein